MIPGNARKIKEAMSLMGEAYTVLHKAKAIERLCLNSNADEMQYDEYVGKEDYISDMEEALALIEEARRYTRGLLR